MSTLRTLRKLILGETWTMPAGIVLVLAASAAARAVLDERWSDVGGLLLLAGVVAVLTVSVAVGVRSRRS